MLYLVATPIGNLEDITLRALKTLREVDLIAAEDTRHSSILLRHHAISKPMISYHQHNEARRTAELLEKLRGGASVAVITDAGMPGVSDPGTRLLKACQEAGVPWTVIPGASAPITALAGSGFEMEAFSFYGFLPVKSGQRRNALLQALQSPGAGLFFESPHRLQKTLAELVEIAPGRPVCVARELTKHFEEFRRGLPGELLEHFSKASVKGEIVLVISPPDREEVRLARKLAKEQAREGGDFESSLTSD